MVDKEKETTIDLFLGIHGVGKTTAEEFYAKVLFDLMISSTSNPCNHVKQSFGRKKILEMCVGIFVTFVKSVKSKSLS